MQMNIFVTIHHSNLTAPPDRGRPPRSTPCPFPRSPPLAPLLPSPFRRLPVSSPFPFPGRLPQAFPPYRQHRGICASWVLLIQLPPASLMSSSPQQSGLPGWLAPSPRSGLANGLRASSRAGWSATNCDFSLPEEPRWHATRALVGQLQWRIARVGSSRFVPFACAPSSPESSRRPPCSSVPNGLEPWPCDSSSSRIAGCSQRSASARTSRVGFASRLRDMSSRHDFATRLRDTTSCAAARGAAAHEGKDAPCP